MGGMVGEGQLVWIESRQGVFFPGEVEFLDGIPRFRVHRQLEDKVPAQILLSLGFVIPSAFGPLLGACPQNRILNIRFFNSCSQRRRR